MIKLSANLGLLWNDQPLVDAVAHAKAAGFDAVEGHCPYATDASDMKAALNEAQLPFLSLNTRVGDASKGEFGVCALPGRESEARGYIDEAIDYAATSGCRNIHLVAGKTAGDASHKTFLYNLKYASEKAEVRGLGVFIEPKSNKDVPGYFLQSVEQASELLKELARDNVSMMFDTYHVQLLQGDLWRTYLANKEFVGHVQFASNPDRNEPDLGEVALAWLLKCIDADGYNGFMGAEYKPLAGPSEVRMDWEPLLRS
ncbi:isomerase [Rhodobacteraceae bacterium RKSG542]|uniref:hydroxypyruvate isomerase family protein n=1 Tax=Pseudovibrio flavus TaxID=2529854 RepID=UPI0012BBF4BC|nr:TIM barrel protein [Pseudovibrio flavus]MTI18165.1 isomerase [Pseudovibrio flavus]